MREKIRRELIIWVQYLVISLAAAVWAYDSHITYYGGGSSEPQAINTLGMVSVMWHSYMLPWLCVFMGLSVVRLSVLLLFSRRRARIP